MNSAFLGAPSEGWGSQKPPLGVGIDQNHPLGRTIAAFYAFNGGSGNTVADASGQRTPAIRMNAAPYWATSTRGPVGLLHNGMNCGANFIGKSCTISAWIYLNSWGDYSAGRLLAVDNDTWYLAIAGGSNARLCTLGGGSATNSLSLNAWYHIAVVNNDGAITFYVNGQPSGAANQSLGHYYASGTLYAGTRYGGDLRTDCLIEYLRIDNDALTASAVRETMQNPYCMFQSGMPLATDSIARPLVDGSLASDTSLQGAVA